MLKTHNLVSILGLAVSLTGCALDDAEIPTDAPEDAVMASAEEVQEIQDWARAAFAGQQPPGPGPTIRVELRRQDHDLLRFGQSCIESSWCGLSRSG
jgi:hypothetical protein